MSKHLAEAFDPNQLAVLESCIPTPLQEWASNNMKVRPSYNDGRTIRDLAAVHAISSADMARHRLTSFDFSLVMGYDMKEEYADLDYKSPLETAGNAAGCLAVTKLMVAWYELGADDFRRLSEIEKRTNPHGHTFFDRRLQSLQYTVGSVPYDIGLTPFSADQVAMEQKLAAQEAVSAGGSSALEPFISFDVYPIR